VNAVDDVDVVVLGLGPGGEELAETLATRGRSVVGVDPRLVGGECPYYGCIPSKMMLRGAEVLQEGRRVAALAGSASMLPDFAPVHARIRDEATDDWDDRVAVERLEGTGATFVRAAGRLDGRDDDGRLLVEAGERSFRAAHVVVATGTAPALPPIPGLSELRASGSGWTGPVWTNRDTMHAETAPPSLVVLGGGPIGCELAQAFARFGSTVTVVANGPQLLPREEPEAGDVLAGVFRREGIDVRLNANTARVSAGGDGIDLTLADGGTVTGTKLLVAAGRTPNLHDIGLSSIGLDDKARSLTVDEHMRVLLDGGPVAGLYAIGDIAGHGAFTHLSVWQARVLVAHLTGEDEPFGGYEGLAWTTFTDPEVGHVGKTEREARDAGMSVRTGTAQISSNTRGWIHGPGNEGFVKVVADDDSGVLVGATAISPTGGEILAVLTLAVHAKVPVSTLLSMHYVYPTLHRAVLEALRALG
jgi:pyruvate/2-oxoglutarate dehydrogenase complex dihydrolipoamide dehydrogenase (E3) component